MKTHAFISVIGISIILLFSYYEFEMNSNFVSNEPLIKTAMVVSDAPVKRPILDTRRPKISNELRDTKKTIRVEKKRNECFELDESTIALWRFNEENGATFKNEKNNVLGNYKGNPTSVKGKFGNAIKFDGIDDYGNCNFNPQEKNCTYEIWYKPDLTPDNDGWVWMGWGLYNSGLIMRGNEISLCEYTSDVKDKTKFRINPNKWNYIAFVFSDNPSEQGLFINGHKIGNLKVARNEPTWNTLWLAVDMTFGANHFLNGTIDEFRISNKPRSQKEIQECWKRNN